MSKKIARQITKSLLVTAIALGAAGCAPSFPGERRIGATELLLTKQKIISVSTINNSNEFHVRLNGEDRDRLLVTASDSERDRLIRNLERKNVPIRSSSTKMPSPLVLYVLPVYVVLTVGGAVFYLWRKRKSR